MTQPTTAQPAPTPSQPAEAPLRSVLTASLAELFAQLNLSLVVSTYQAGKGGCTYTTPRMRANAGASKDRTSIPNDG